MVMFLSKASASASACPHEMLGIMRWESPVSKTTPLCLTGFDTLCLLLKRIMVTGRLAPAGRRRGFLISRRPWISGRLTRNDHAHLLDYEHGQRQTVRRPDQPAKACGALGAALPSCRPRLHAVDLPRYSKARQSGIHYRADRFGGNARAGERTGAPSHRAPAMHGAERGLQPLARRRRSERGPTLARASPQDQRSEQSQPMPIYARATPHT